MLSDHASPVSRRGERGCERRASPVLRAILAAAVVVVVLAMAIGVAAAGSGGKRGVVLPSRKGVLANRTFHCYRPFDAIQHFTPKDMANDDNCLFTFFHVRNASVSLDCDTTSKNESRGCRAIAHVAVTVARQAHADDVRYTVELRGAGKQVHYKGFAMDSHGNEGYSACCELLDGGACEWEELAGSTAPHGDAEGTEPKKNKDQLVVKSCPLHTKPLSKIEAALQQVPLTEPTVFTGNVSRPLYRTEAGEWEMRIHFYRKLRVAPLGKIVIPFTVNAAQVPPTMNAANEAAASAEAVVVAGRQQEL